jgi:multidrug efflux pump subunit AcrB
MTSIIRFFVTNKHFTLIATVGFFLFSVLSIVSMRIQLNPDIQFPTLKLTVSYPQANQETLKTTVIEPLIPLLRENDRILASQFQIQDQHAEGVFTFSVYDDLDRQFWSLNQKLQKVSQSLPDQVQFSLSKAQLSQVLTPFVIAIKGENLQDAYDDALALKQQLLWVSDVSEVSLLGNTSSLWLALDSLSMLRHQLSYQHIFNQIKVRNTDVIQGSTMIGDLIIPVSFKTAVNSIKELKEMLFYPPEGQPLRLDKLAQFNYKEDVPIRLSTLDGEPTLLLSVQLRDKANILQASKAVNALIDHHERAELLYDEAVEIRYHLKQLMMNLVQGLLILFVVLFLLLGFRSGLLISLLLPVTVLFAIGFLNLLGQPLQQVSIAGLIISLGLLIDNAVVVTESCSQGEDTVRQTALVSRPLIFSTITTILAFLPIYFLKTEAGLFLKSVSLTIAVTLFASILLALTIIPFFLSFQRKTVMKRPLGHRCLVWIRDRYYMPFLTRTIYSKWVVVGIISVVLVGGCLLINSLSFQLFPPSSDQYGTVTLMKYSGDSDALFKERLSLLTDRIKQIVPTQFIVQTVGTGFPRVNYSMTSYHNDSDIAQLFFKIDDKRSKKHDYINQLKAALIDLPFLDAVSVQEFMFNQGASFPLTIQMSGHSLQVLEKTALDIQTWAKAHPQIVGVLSSNEEHHLGISYQLDQDKLVANHLSEEEVRLAIQFAITGKYVMSLYDRSQQRVPVMMSIDRSADQTPQDVLRSVFITNNNGQSFPLSEFLTVDLQSYPKSQWIKDDLPTVKLTIQLQSDRDYDRVMSSLMPKIAALEASRSIQLTVISEDIKRSDNFLRFTWVSLFFIVLIFAILVIVFQSFKLPVVIFTALPVSFVGGICGLVVMGQSLSLFAYLGFISLAGIVINDSILLIDSYEMFKKEGKGSLSSQLVKAAESRFIPVNTTSITTVLGVLPLAIVNSLFQPLAIVLMGGVLVSTVVILITVPILVYWFES